MSAEFSRIFRIWFLPFSLLVVATVVIAIGWFMVDADGDLERLQVFLHPNAASAESMVGNAAEVVAAVLGIAVTVVAIVVELAANRYTHRITELFVHEPVNFVVMGFFVVASLQGLLVGIAFDVDGDAASGFVPYVGAALANGMVGLGLLILLPYFAFVFDFLNPIHIVDRLRAHTIAYIVRHGRMRVAAAQSEAVRGIEQLADVGLNAMEHKDKGVSMASCDALQQMVLDYQAARADLPDAWYRIEGDLAHNPDFVSMSESVLDAVTQRRIWFEMKVLRKYQTLYNEALNKMRDINYLVAINTRHIAERALADGHVELFDLTVKFFNTYLRATVNAKDVRTAYNVLHQYRLLADVALRSGYGDRAVEIAKYFRYYGFVSFQSSLPFILETVAYDLCELNELAHDLESPVAHELLHIFLQVDKEGESAAQETSLRGVRKAQIKLATHYLREGATERAREVYRDMEHERVERLASIRDELLGVTSPEFWEISDRGRNFDYLPPERKARMLEFFSWFERLPRVSADRISADVLVAVPASAVERASNGDSTEIPLELAGGTQRSGAV